MPDGVKMVVTQNNWRDAQVKAAVRAQTKVAAIEAGRAILAEANKMVPEDKGRLKKSGNVTEVTRTGTTSAAIFYDTPYAVRLHEHPEYRFQKGRQGKWLEKALDTARREVLTTMVRAYSRLFGKGMMK